MMVLPFLFISKLLHTYMYYARNQVYEILLQMTNDDNLLLHSAESWFLLSSHFFFVLLPFDLNTLKQNMLV